MFLIDDSKIIFKLHDANFSLNKFYFWNEVLLKHDNLIDASLLGTQRKMALSLYMLLKIDLTLNPLMPGGNKKVTHT